MALIPGNGGDGAATAQRTEFDISCYQSPGTPEATTGNNASAAIPSASQLAQTLANILSTQSAALAVQIDYKDAGGAIVHSQIGGGAYPALTSVASGPIFGGTVDVASTFASINPVWEAANMVFAGANTTAQTATVKRYTYTAVAGGEDTLTQLSATDAGAGGTTITVVDPGTTTPAAAAQKYNVVKSLDAAGAVSIEAYNADTGAEVDISAGIPASWTLCNDAATTEAEKVVSDFIEYFEPLTERVVSFEVPGGYTLEQGYAVVSTSNLGVTNTLTRGFGAHPNANDQINDWRDFLADNYTGAWTNVGAIVTGVIPVADPYPVSLIATVSTELNFNSGAATQIVVDEEYESVRGDLTANIVVGTVNTNTGLTGGNGLTVGAATTGQPDILTLSSTFPGWVQPDRVVSRVNDLDPGPGEFIEYGVTPISVDPAAVGGAVNFTVTGNRVDPTANNVDILATLPGFTTLTLQQRDFVGGSNRIGYRFFRAEWDYDIAISDSGTTAAAPTKAVRCGETEFTDLAGAPIAEPDEFAGCGTYEYLRSLGLISGLLPSYADDAAATIAGLTAGQQYQTDGSGAAPLDVAGIVMVKQ